MTAVVLLVLGMFHAATIPFVTLFDNFMGGIFAFALLTLAIIEVGFVSFDPATGVTFYIQAALESSIGQSLRGIQGFIIFGLSAFTVIYKLQLHSRKWRIYRSKAEKMWCKSRQLLLRNFKYDGPDTHGGVKDRDIVMQTYESKSHEDLKNYFGANPATAVSPGTMKTGVL